MTNSELQQAWQSTEILSSKYGRLFEDLDQYAADDDKKVVIVSGFYQTDVTSEQEPDRKDQFAFLSLYEQLHQHYTPAKKFLKIDGTVSLAPKNGQLAEREQIRREFRTNPNAWLLTTNRASRLGIDLSIPDTPANKNIKELVIIHLDHADTYADEDQFLGRFLGVGQKVPVRRYYYTATRQEYPDAVRYGMIDHGITEALRYKMLLSQMMLDGIPLTPKQEEFVKSNLSHIKVSSQPVTPSRFLYDVFFRLVRGQGYEQNMRLFSSLSNFEGLTYAEFFQAYYPYHDELTIAGHNARAVSEVVRRFQTDRKITRPLIASIGCGAGIFQYSLGQRVTNVDMSPEMLKVARGRQVIEGEFLEGNAANLPIPSESQHITEAGLMIHWSNHKEKQYLDNRGNERITERMKILIELFRVTTTGGLISITVPHTHLNPASFSRWLQALETHFGGRPIPTLPSGLISATDFRTEPISWIFNLEKIGDPNLADFDPTSLALDFEPLTDIIDTKDRRNGGEINLEVRPPIPHQEFRIDAPGTTKSQHLRYNLPDLKTIIEKGLLPERKKSIAEVLADEVGIDEPGMVWRLRHFARQSWQSRMPFITDQEVEEQILTAFETWSVSKRPKHSSEVIWDDLQSILNMLMGAKYHE